MNVAVIGRTETLYLATKEVAARGYDIPIIVTYPAASHYRRTSKDFQKLASKAGSEFVETTNLNTDKIRQSFQSKNVDIAISVNWKTLIQKSILNIFDHGIINCHAGDLPRFRGNAATNWALIAGEDEVVYTLHRMTEELDAGPILCKKSMSIDHETTIRDILNFGRENVPQMFADVVEKIDKNVIKPKPQKSEEKEVLRCYPRHPRDSKLDWEKSAEYLDRVVRATSEPFFGAYTYLNNDVLRIWEASFEEPPTPYLGVPGQVAERRPNEGSVAVITGDGFLILEEIQIEDEERKEATEIIKSNRTRLGMDTEKHINELEERIAELENDTSSQK